MVGDSIRLISLDGLIVNGGASVGGQRLGSGREDALPLQAYSVASFAQNRGFDFPYRKKSVMNSFETVFTSVKVLV